MNSQPGQIVLLISLAGVGASAGAETLLETQAPDLVSLRGAARADHAEPLARELRDGLAELEWQGPLTTYGRAAAATDAVATEALGALGARRPTLTPVAPVAAKPRRSTRVLAALPRASIEKIEVAANGSSVFATTEPVETHAPTSAAEAVTSAAPVDHVIEDPGSFAGPDSALAVAPAAAAPRSENSLAKFLEGHRRLAEPSATETVLQTLEAMLSGVRDEVGAVVTPPSTTASASAPVEDGPTRRLRKLAARAVKAAELAEATNVANAASAAAEPSPLQPGASPFGDRTVAVAESALDRVRGGFEGGGLNISFGIERAVYVNGALVTTTTLNVSELGKLTAGRGPVAIDAGTIALIQNGMGNGVSASTLTSTSAGTIVQNTLDGQKIQNVTVINATANSLGVLRGMNFQSSLRSAVVDSLRR